MTASTTDSAAGTVQHTFRIEASDHLITRYVVAAVALSFLDLAFPLPIPGLKPGLANIVTLVALSHLGWKNTCWITLLRLLSISLLIGNFLTPGFWLSLSGSLSSLFILSGSLYLPKKYFGPVTQSLLGAWGHLAGQLLIVHLFLFPLHTIETLLPIFTAFSLLTGLINGLIASSILSKIPSPLPKP